MAKKALILFAFGFFIILFTHSTHAQQRFVANLSGVQALPFNQSGGRGVCRATLQTAEMQLVFSCNYNNLSSALFAAKMHKGRQFNHGPVVYDFPATGGRRNGSFAGTFNVTQQDIADLRANRFYINIYTHNFPEAEIRGQIKLANGFLNDHDGDGKSDLVVYRPSTNTFFVWQTMLDNLFTDKKIGQPGDTVLPLSDFDGDGRADFATYGSNGSFVWRIFHSGSNTFQESVWGDSRLNDALAAADFDADGRFDITVFRNGIWYVIESSTGNYRYEAFGTTGDIPAPADYDGDGRADLTIIRNIDGIRFWFTQLSTTGQTRAIDFGFTTDEVITGRNDFDGDGAADLTVIRIQNGIRVFYVKRSSDAGIQAQPYGLATDDVRLGDYDGDGKTDYATTRPVNALKGWFVYHSSTGAIDYRYFGLPGDY